MQRDCASLFLRLIGIFFVYVCLVAMVFHSYYNNFRGEINGSLTTISTCIVH